MLLSTPQHTLPHINTPSCTHPFSNTHRTRQSRWQTGHKSAWVRWPRQVKQIVSSPPRCQNTSLAASVALGKHSDDRDAVWVGDDRDAVWVGGPSWWGTHGWGVFPLCVFCAFVLDDAVWSCVIVYDDFDVRVAAVLKTTIFPTASFN